MNTIESIYVLTTLISVITAIPQLRRLWTLKNSDEFNLLTWIAWLIAQLAALVYSISISSIPYLIVNILWISFYLAMIGLIIKFKENKRLSFLKVKSDEKL